LPQGLITMQHNAHSWGYFSGKQFAHRSDGEQVVDEIGSIPQSLPAALIAFVLVSVGMLAA
jgi:hypothetical protein